MATIRVDATDARSSVCVVRVVEIGDGSDPDEKQSQLVPEQVIHLSIKSTTASLIQSQSIKQFVKLVQSFPNMKHCSLQATNTNQLTAIVAVMNLHNIVLESVSVYVVLLDDQGDATIQDQDAIQMAMLLLRTKIVHSVNLNWDWSWEPLSILYRWMIQHPHRIVLNEWISPKNMFSYSLYDDGQFISPWQLVRSLQHAQVYFWHNEFSFTGLVDPTVNEDDIEYNQLDWMDGVSNILKAPNLTSVSLTIDDDDPLEEGDDTDYTHVLITLLSRCRTLRRLFIDVDTSIVNRLKDVQWGDVDEKTEDPGLSDIRGVIQSVIQTAGVLPEFTRLILSEAFAYGLKINIDANMFSRLTDLVLSSSLGELDDMLTNCEPLLARVTFVRAVTSHDFEIVRLLSMCPRLQHLSNGYVDVADPSSWMKLIGAMSKHGCLTEWTITSSIFLATNDQFDEFQLSQPPPDASGIPLIWLNLPPDFLDHLNGYDDHIDDRETQRESKKWLRKAFQNLIHAVKQNEQVSGLDAMRSHYLACMWANRTNPLRNACMDFVLNDPNHRLPSQFKLANGAWRSGMLERVRNSIADAVFVPDAWQTVRERWNRQVEEKTMSTDDYNTRVERMDAAEKKLRELQLYIYGVSLGRGTKADMKSVLGRDSVKSIR